MKIIIAGGGRVGQYLAKELSQHGHDLVMIERDKKSADRAGDMFDISVINADACDMGALRKAAEGGADAMIAVTESDEVNLALCALSRKLDVDRRIVRIRNESWFSEGGLDQAELAIDKVIHPEKEAAEYIEKIISMEAAFDYAELGDGEAALIGFNVDASLAILDYTLADLMERFSLDSFLIIGVYRDDRFFVPHGGDTLAGGDKLWIMVARDTIPFMLPIFKARENGKKEKAIIFGASRVGLKVAESFGKEFSKVVLIESQAPLARMAGEALEDVQVLNVDIAGEPDFLKELEPESVDCFVAVSADGGKNLITGLLAKRLGVKKVVVVTDESGYMPVMNAIGLDIIVNPYFLTAGAILRHIRKGIARSVIKLMAGQAQALEYEVSAGSRVAGKPLAKAGLPEGSVVGMIIREDSVIIPNGATELAEADKVFVVTTSEKSATVEKLFVPSAGIFSF